MRTRKNPLWTLCQMLGVMALTLTLNSSMCSEDEETSTSAFKSVWQYESFVCEAYTADGSNPYLADGRIEPEYPLGVTITRDRMRVEADDLWAFGKDGFIYRTEISDINFGWMDSYQWDGGKYIEGGNSMFYPAGQEAPAEFGATLITNEVLKYTDTELQVKQTQIDGKTGTRLIFTNHFVRVYLE